MSLKLALVKTPNYLDKLEFLLKIQGSYPYAELIIFSVSPHKRALLRQKFPRAVVINPFRPFSLNNRERKNTLLWLDEWPSLGVSGTGGSRGSSGSSSNGEDYWENFWFEISGVHGIAFLSQSFTHPRQELLWQECDRYGERQIIWDEACPGLPLIPSAKLAYMNIFREEGDFPITSPYQWPTHRQQSLVVVADLLTYPFLFSLGVDHHIKGIVYQVASPKMSYLMFPLKSCYWWLQGGQVVSPLVDLEGENQSRRNSPQKGSLSRSSHHRHASFKKWSSYYGSFLRRSRWWQKIKIQPIGVGLSHLNRAWSQSFNSKYAKHEGVDSGLGS